MAGDPFPVHKGARAIDVTVSIGMAQRQGSDADADDILKRADQALYSAKRGGRDRIEIA